MWHGGEVGDAMIVMKMMMWQTWYRYLLLLFLLDPVLPPHYAIFLCILWRLNGYLVPHIIISYFLPPLPIFLFWYVLFVFVHLHCLFTFTLCPRDIYLFPLYLFVFVLLFGLV